MKHKFRVGDRVRVVCTDNTAGFNLGDTGTVCSERYSANCDDLGVAGDVYVGGHDCCGECEYGYGWWIPPHHVELIVESEDDLDFVVDLDALL